MIDERRRRTGGRHARSGGDGPRVLARVAGALAALLSATPLVGFGYGWYEYGSLNGNLDRVHLPNLARPTGTARNGHGVEQNILLVGLDSRAGLSPAEQRALSVGSDQSMATDTIVVLHVPADGSAATMISIPRDSYVDIPGYLKNKINAAYADAWSDAQGDTKTKQAAGMNELVATVSKLTGLQINHYVQVGFGGFYTITKVLGDIAVDLCAATDDTIAHNVATGQGHVGSNFRMSAGKHDLTPVQALEFVRQRHNLHGGDLAREKRQQYFLKAAFGQIASSRVLLNPGRLAKLIKAVTGAFTIDDGFSLTDLAGQLADLSANKITGLTIPTNGGKTVVVAGQRLDVQLVTPPAVQTRIKQVLAGPAPAPRSSTAPLHPPSGSGAAHGSSGCIY